jgi:hypothetical protein
VLDDAIYTDESDETNTTPLQSRSSLIHPAPVRLTRPRREKSGVPALDRYPDKNAEATEKEDDEDDDWNSANGEDHNGTRGTSLFARGVVDRYRLAVFRKALTPSQRQGTGAWLTFRRQFLRPKSPPLPPF